MFQDDFKVFIFSRINETVDFLKRYNIHYKSTNDKYNEIYERLTKDLTPTQRQDLDDLLSSLNAIASEEQRAIYITATKDTIKLRNEQFMDNDFDIPHYIFEELIRYYNKNKSPVVWDNLVSLLNLAKVNGRLSQEQVDFLKENYK